MHAHYVSIMYDHHLDITHGRYLAIMHEILQDAQFTNPLS